MIMLPMGWLAEPTPGWPELAAIVHEPCGWRSELAYDLARDEDCAPVLYIIAGHLCTGRRDDRASDTATAPADRLMQEILADSNPTVRHVKKQLAAYHAAVEKVTRTKAYVEAMRSNPGGTDTATAAAELADILELPPPCPDCRGTGEAAGGYPGEDCPTCHGTSEAPSEGSSA